MYAYNDVIYYYRHYHYDDIMSYYNTWVHARTYTYGSDANRKKKKGGEKNEKGKKKNPFDGVRPINITRALRVGSVGSVNRIYTYKYIHVR